jgi:hypothetical protein
MFDAGMHHCTYAAHVESSLFQQVGEAIAHEREQGRR